MNAIVLLPSSAHRAELLAAGPCGACPPTVWRDDATGFWSLRRPVVDAAGPLDAGLPDPPSSPALVLAWEGVPVPEGIDRVQRVLAVAILGFASGLRWTYLLGDAQRAALDAQAAGLGTFVNVREAAWTV